MLLHELKKKIKHFFLSKSMKSSGIIHFSFQENWLINLKHTLEQFLINYSCGDDVIPRLVKFCLKSEAYDTANDSASLLNENTKRFKEVKRKLHRLKKDHQKLVGNVSKKKKKIVLLTFPKCVW